jgi:hypothetical protein
MQNRCHAAAREQRPPMIVLTRVRLPGSGWGGEGSEGHDGDGNEL